MRGRWQLQSRAEASESMEFILEPMKIDAEEAIQKKMEQSPDLILDQDEQRVSPEGEEATLAKALRALYLSSQQEADDRKVTHLLF